MKVKAFALILTMALLAAAPAFAQRRVVTTPTSGGRTVVANHFHRPYCRGGGVTWSVGIGFPFYGGYYGGYPYGTYPYFGGSSYGGYYPSGAYGYGYYPAAGYSYSGGYYGASSGYDGAPSYRRQGYEGRSGSTVARVQERLARGGYYSGRIDGVMGPRTRSAIRAYERRHGLPADGVIDRELLATMRLA